jgi:cation diffusion facilitator CzcD-associated flavoprotein CzcO
MGGNTRCVVGSPGKRDTKRPVQHCGVDGPTESSSLPGAPATAATGRERTPSQGWGVAALRPGFETYNRDNVDLVNISQTPIERLTPDGLMVNGRGFTFDAIVFATGFDAMTGTLFNVDIRGRAGLELKSKWAAGPRTYLGLMTESFPNLFMITGPGSPSVKSNMITSIEQHVELVADTIIHMRDQGLAVIEPELLRRNLGHGVQVILCAMKTRHKVDYYGTKCPFRPKMDPK